MNCAFHVWVFAWFCKDFASDYLELKKGRQDIRDNYKLFVPMNQDFRYINVTDHHRNVMAAMVDAEDYDRLVSLSNNWRVDTKGYVVSSTRVGQKFTRLYLHREVLGKTGTHVNGDRLDNRKKNLVESTKKRKSFGAHENEREFKIQKIDCSPQKFHCEDPLLPTISNENATVYYNGKAYVGKVERGIPHGCGQLYEQDEHKLTIGTWDRGVIVDGLIIAYKPLPPQMCFCPRFRDIDHVRVVYGKTVKMPFSYTPFRP